MRPPIRWQGNKNFFPLLCFTLLLVLFYPTLWLAKSGSIIGDHLTQHYPWSFLLWKSLQTHALPFWTFSIQSGFPIAAESQIGVFYLPNLILGLLLPFHWAYSYANLLHFWIAGIGTYFYARKLKLDPPAALISAVLFVFGAGYGGAYYNITSLKTIAWFPVVLLLLERWIEKKQKSSLLWLGFVLSQAMMAGYIQVAICMFLIFTIYALVRIFIFGTVKPGKTWGMAAGVLAAFGVTLLLALPQLFLTFELALQSNRIGLNEEYAYVGSMSPFVVFTLIVPSAQGLFRGNSIYCGIFALFLLFAAFSSKNLRRKPDFKLWLVIAGVAFLLAIGQWSPLYVALVKITRFYSFRTPMKFIIFVSFGLSLICGMGFQELWKNATSEEKIVSAKNVGALYMKLFGGLLLSGLILYYFLTGGRESLNGFGETLVKNMIYGKTGHPHSLEFYLDRVQDYLFKVETLFLLKAEPYFRLQHLSGYLMAVAGLPFALFLVMKKKITKGWLFSGITFLLIDLYIFSAWDIQQDFGRYDSAPTASPILETLKQERAAKQLHRLYGFRENNGPLPLLPSFNMFDQVEDIGIYSPFVLKRYFEVYGAFGNIDDSNASLSPDSNFVQTHLALLRLADVSHVLANRKLNWPDFELIQDDSESSFYLYRSRALPQGAFFVNRVEISSGWEQLKAELFDPQFTPERQLLLEEGETEKLSGGEMKGQKEIYFELKKISSASERERWRIQVNQPGFFVLSNTYYPGWSAELNGKAAPILKAYGIFQAIEIPDAGNFTVELQYHPFKRSPWDQLK